MPVKRLPLDPWSFALVLMLGMAWHGGLHAWQVFAASVGIALLWWNAPQRWSLPWPYLLGFVGVLGWQALVSVQAQVSVDQVFWLLALVVLAQTLRRNPKPSPASLGWVVGLAVLAALTLFGRAAWVLHRDPGKLWVGTELVAVATHWFFPNQNLLVVGVLLPGFLVALAWIYRRVGREGRGDPAPTDVLGWVAWVVIGAGIVYAGSRGGLLALAGAGTWWLGRAFQQDGVSRRLALVALLLGVTLGLSWRSPLAGLQRRAEANASPQHQDAFRSQRTQFWRASLLASAERPFQGWGQGTFAEAIQRQDVGAELSPRNPIARYRLRLEHAHNEALEMAVELGWPAALTLCALALAFFWMRWRAPEADASSWSLEAFLVGVAMHAMVDMPLRPAFLQLVYAMSIAWLWPTKSDDVKTRPAPAMAAILVLGVLLSLGAWMGWGPSTAPRDETIKQHLQRRPYDVLGWFDLARQAHALGDSAVAHLALDRAIALEPNFFDAWMLRRDLARAERDSATTKRADVEIKRILDLEIPEDQADDPYCLRLLSTTAPLDSGKKP